MAACNVGVVPSATMQSKDGKYVIIGGNGDSVFSRLMTAVGRPDMAASNPLYATNSLRCQRADEIYKVILPWRLSEQKASVSACLPARPSLCPSVCLSVCLTTFLSMCPVIEVFLAIQQMRMISNEDMIQVSPPCCMFQPMTAVREVKPNTGWHSSCMSSKSADRSCPRCQKQRFRCR